MNDPDRHTARTLREPPERRACAGLDGPERNAQVAGDLADGGAAGVVMPADGQQQLVLGRGDPGRLGLLPAPGQEPSQPGAEGEQPLVVVVVQS